MTPSKKTFLFFTILLGLLVLAPRAYSIQNLKKSSSSDIPIQVHGDSVEYFHAEEKVVGTGHVSIDYEDVRLTADKITVFMAAKKALAEGHVVLKQKGSVFTGERAEYDYVKRLGEVSKMTAVIEPSYYGKAARIQKISDNHYRAIDSCLSTCEGDDPFYKIQAREVDIYPDEKVVVKNALLTVRGVPVLYVPYLATYFIDFERFPVQIIPGKNEEWGPFVLSKWRYHLIDEPSIQSKGNVLLDYREKRGFGYGVENFYKGDNLGRGAARVYTVDDDAPPANTDSQRYRAQWRHQSKLVKSTTLTTEINKLSDADVIKDFFFREEYERDVFPDNYVSIITAKPEYTFSFLMRERLDDFFQVVERSPELRFDTYNRPFQDTPFYLRQEGQFSNLHSVFPNSDQELNVSRFDSNTTLAYAGRVGAVSVTPRVGTRQTYYSRDAQGERDLGRATFEPGLDLSTRFYRIYDTTVKAFGLDYNQIRHIFTPTLSYQYRPNPTVSKTTLQPFDALDAIDKQNFIRFNFENKLQTKEHTSPATLTSREIARVIPFFDTDLHTGRLNNVGIDVELRPYSWMGIESDASYNAVTRDVEAANVDFYLQKKNFKAGVGQRYVQNNSSQTTAELGWKISPEWEFKVYERYEFEKSRPEEFEITVSKTFSCLIVDFTYNHRTGDTFYFVFRLKAFPKSSFGLRQSYSPPKASPRG
jgi:LPS-assembly protein